LCVWNETSEVYALGHTVATDATNEFSRGFACKYELYFVSKACPCESLYSPELVFVRFAVADTKKIWIRKLAGRSFNAIFGVHPASDIYNFIRGYSRPTDYPCTGKLRDSQNAGGPMAGLLHNCQII
jgi:hypothetical protein